MQVKETHSLAVEHVASQLETHLENGLSQAEANARLVQHGPNELAERPRPGFFRLLLSQFDNFLVIILIAAAVASLLLGELIDAGAILAIVVLNSVLGVIQESKAEQALEALQKMSAPTATVIRDGRRDVIAARELVPGDVVLLEAGNYVPADVRLVESHNLQIEEASLTGESVPSDKNARVVLESEIPLGDRKNSAFMSTVVTYGRGKGVVASTGMNTQIGLIAEMIQSYEEEPTPLQQKLDQLGKWLGLAALIACVIIFAIGVARDTNPALILSAGLGAYLAAFQANLVELFLTAVSLAIAAVPEGLPAVVTICLALGMQRMIARHALIRKLPAVETLGSATVICSDKTGTLTQNQMTVLRGWAGGKNFKVTGEGYAPRGQFAIDGQPFDPLADPAASLLLQGAVLCNDARLEASGEEGGEQTWRMVGDPTEGALVVAAAKAGLWREELERTWPRQAEIPFDSERKRMTTIHPAPSSLGTPFVAFVKGAPDIVIQYCDQILEGSEVKPLSDAKRQEVREANQDMARQALRVLGLAYRPLASLPESPSPESVEKGLVFIGLLGMLDPARSEVKAAVRVAKQASLKTVMVTGDYRETAVAIGRELGIVSPSGRVLTGAELDRMSDEELAQIVDHVDAYARVSPQHKVKIVEAFKQRGHVVAMTGDGVNDAPALKRADIGVAMGITGTDVSKQTADMVLTDDNYVSIVSAIEEGRIIYSNIRKFVFYLISANVGEVLIIFLAMLSGLPAPLRPIQLLWLNLITDGAPALALGLEKGEADIMQRPPRPVNEPVISRDMRIGIAAISLADTVAVLASFVLALSRSAGDVTAAQTAAFATLVCSELLRAYTSRSEYHSVFSTGIFSNRWMVIATASSFVLLLLVIYVPFLQVVFGTISLGPGDWLAIAPLALIAPLTAELVKAILRSRQTQTVEV